jgi:hypothetical protein
MILRLEENESIYILKVQSDVSDCTESVNKRLVLSVLCLGSWEGMAPPNYHWGGACEQTQWAALFPPLGVCLQIGRGVSPALADKRGQGCAAHRLASTQQPGWENSFVCDVSC